MREIKFRYRIQDLKTKKITIFHRTLEQIELGCMFDFCFDKDENEIRKILSRDLCTGRKDIHDEDIYDNDNVRGGLSDNEKLTVKWCDIEAGFNLYKENGEFVWGSVGFNTEIIKEKETSLFTKMDNVDKRMYEKSIKDKEKIL